MIDIILCTNLCEYLLDCPPFMTCKLTTYTLWLDFLYLLSFILNIVYECYTKYLLCGVQVRNPHISHILKDTVGVRTAHETGVCA